MPRDSRPIIERDGARMRYRFEPMSQRQAHAIAAWRYDPPYDFYDAVADPEDLAELLDPVQREGRYFAVLSDPDGLVGLFVFKREGDAVEVGLGLRPDLTNRGLGRSFLLAGLAFARERYAPARFRLAVAAFNQRAIRVYERAGFRQRESYMHWTNGGEHAFLRMERPA
jgi:[ribosomal protein S18]-alanine N-acetyltransferase